MLKSLTVSGFGPFKAARLDLQPFTILIGPNNSGKTTLTRALHIARALRSRSVNEALGELGLTPGRWLFHQLGRQEIGLDITYSSGTKHSLLFQLSGVELHVVHEGVLDSQNFAMFIRETKNKIVVNAEELVADPRYSAVETLWHNRPGLRETLDRLVEPGNVRGLSLDGAAAAHSDHQGAVPRVMKPGGANLAGTYLGFLKEKPEAYAEVFELVRLLPDMHELRGIRLDRLPGAEGDSLFFEFPYGKLPVNVVSEGVLKAFAYYLTVGMSEPGDLIWIEEPERGLHPRALEDLLRNLYSSCTKKGVQLVIVTHSPDIVDVYQQIRGDSQRVQFLESVVTLHREDGGQPVIRSLADAPDRVKRELDTYFLGELWALRGERWLATGQQ
jgi:energy-coupling factor transporter ATP-binding protein EcfA2